MPNKFLPFENESQALSFGDLNIENRVDRVSIFGSLDLTKDMRGLADALELKRLLDSVVDELKRSNLPDSIETEAPKVVKNPFK
jgi:hypothetical protein